MEEPGSIVSAIDWLTGSLGNIFDPPVFVATKGQLASSPRTGVNQIGGSKSDRTSNPGSQNATIHIRKS